MAKVRAALIQAYANMPKEEAIKKHEELIGQAAAKGAQITCLQEIFFGPYFPAEQNTKWYDTAAPNCGPTEDETEMMCHETRRRKGRDEQKDKTYEVSHIQN